MGFHSGFLREYAKLFGSPTRLDRIPMTNFERKIFVARVRTVERGAAQERIPEGLRYSVISELVRIKEA